MARLRHLGLLTTLVSGLHAAYSTGNPQITVRNGTYEGIHLSAFDQDIFLGIPYAQDTGGLNRFRPPQSLNTTWNGTRPAKQYGDACPDFRPDQDAAYGMSEDCLSINVVKPAGLKEGEKIPVVVWIHGGSYQVGTSGLPNYNLTWLIQRSGEIGKPIIATSINYRKGELSECWSPRMTNLWFCRRLGYAIQPGDPGNR